MIVQAGGPPLSSPHLDGPTGAAVFYGWKLLFVFWLVLLVASAFPLYGGGVMNAYMAADLRMDRSLIGLPMSIYQFAFGLGAPVVGLIVDRFGIRATLIGGALLLATAALLLGFVVSSSLGAILVFGVLLGTGAAAAGGITTQAGVARWFTRRRALAIAILMSAPGTGGFIVAPLINRVIVAADSNWRAGWWLTAAVATGAAVIAYLFVRERPSDIGQHPDGATPDAAGASGSGGTRALRGFISTEDWTRSEVLRTRAFWLLLIAAFGVNMGYTLYFAVGLVHLQDLGHAKSVGAWALSIFGISTLLGKIALGTLGDRYDPRYVWAATAAAFGVGLIVLSTAVTDARLFACIVLLGFGFGGGLASMFAVLSNYFGPKAFPSVAGLGVAITTCAGALAPPIAGLLYGQSGSYRPTFLLISAWCFAGAVLMAITPRPRKREAASAEVTAGSRLTGAR